jgi:hypothetical protein
MALLLRKMLRQRSGIYVLALLLLLRSSDGDAERIEDVHHRART